MLLPRRVPLIRVRAGTRWMRVHERTREALWFGPAPGSPPLHRFDDPLGRFRVCYFGTTTEVCFAETFLRNPPVRILALDDLAARSLASVEVQAELRLVGLHGSGLARLGTTAEPAGGGEYGLSQSWSRALWEHRDRPDGILYRPRHDDSALCAAVYDRARGRLRMIGDEPLTKDTRRLARLLKRYELGLTT